MHPVTARLAPTAAGLVRDLEGEITKTITNSDISFHALRAYEPGDALRNVHWRTSARTGQLMVRQFEETRRSQLADRAVDRRAPHYASDDEFELAVSVIASIGVQVIRDGTRAGHRRPSECGLRTATPTALLDDTSRIEPVRAAAAGPTAAAGTGAATIRDFVRERTQAAADAQRRDRRRRVARAARRVPRRRDGVRLGHRRPSAFRAELGAASRIAKVAGLTVVTIGAIDELSRLMRRVRP